MSLAISIIHLTYVEEIFITEVMVDNVDMVIEVKVETSCSHIVIKLIIQLIHVTFFMDFLLVIILEPLPTSLVPQSIWLLEAQRFMNARSLHQTTSNGVLLSQEQYNTLMELLQQSKSQASSYAYANTVMDYNTNSLTFNIIPLTSFGKNITSYIIDTWATNNINLDLYTFINCQLIKPSRIDMPNNTYTTPELARTVNVSTYLQLHNVLFISNFHANLVFVPKLISDNNCYIVLTK